MKSFFCIVVVVALIGVTAMCGCSNIKSETISLAEGEFLIDGHLPAEKFDGVCLYLVPMEGPHPRPVDSVFIGKDGKFQFRGNVEQMAVLRVAMMRRYGVQELLVVTEPGVTYVTLDSISSSHGTPQNDALQRWKDYRTSMIPVYARINQLRTKYGNNNPEFKNQFEAYCAEVADFNYTLLKSIGRQTLSVYLYKSFMRSGMDSLRHAELDELLKDTVDYSQPRPGFHL